MIAGRSKPRERRLVSNDWQRVGIVASMRYEQILPGHGTGRKARMNWSSACRSSICSYKGRIVQIPPSGTEAVPVRIYTVLRERAGVRKSDQSSLFL